jgi:hypothetical protein
VFRERTTTKRGSTISLSVKLCLLSLHQKFRTTKEENQVKKCDGKNYDEH